MMGNGNNNGLIAAVRAEGRADARPTKETMRAAVRDKVRRGSIGGIASSRHVL